MVWMTEVWNRFRVKKKKVSIAFTGLLHDELEISYLQRTSFELNIDLAVH